jgi:predicted HTH domain antitoxin
LGARSNKKKQDGEIENIPDQALLLQMSKRVIFKKRTKMDLLIKEEVLKKAEITAEELLIEMAVHLYDMGRLSMGQARNLAELDQISFQKEMTKRDVHIKYDVEDLETDLENLKKIRVQRSS